MSSPFCCLMCLSLALPLWWGNPWTLWAHLKGDLNFCIPGTPQLQVPHGWSVVLHLSPTQSTFHLGVDLTTSPRRTRRLFRTHLLILILSSAVVSSERTMHTVSLRLLPFRRTVSPRNSCSSSILACDTTRKEHSNCEYCHESECNTTEITNISITYTFRRTKRLTKQHSHKIKCMLV